MEPGYTGPLDEAVTNRRFGEGAAALSANGVLGDPRGSSPATGHDQELTPESPNPWLSEVVARLVARNWPFHPPDAGLSPWQCEPKREILRNLTQLGLTSTAVAW
jgi:hypothetical protein